MSGGHRRRSGQRRRAKSMPPRRTVDDYPDRKQVPGMVFTALGLIIPIAMVIVAQLPGLKDERGVLTGGAFAAIVGSFWMCAGLAFYEGDWCNCTSMLIEWLFFIIITLAGIFIIVVNVSNVIFKTDEDRDTAINFAFVAIGVLLITQQWLTWMYICDCLDSDRDQKYKKEMKRRRAWEREDEYWRRREEATYGDVDVRTDYIPYTARETRLNLMHPTYNRWQRQRSRSWEDRAAAGSWRSRGRGSSVGSRAGSVEMQTRGRARSGSLEKTRVERFYKKPKPSSRDSDDDLCTMGCSPLRSRAKSAPPRGRSWGSSDPRRPSSLPPTTRNTEAPTLMPASNLIRTTPHVPPAPNRLRDPGRTPDRKWVAGPDPRARKTVQFEYMGEDL